MDPDADLASVAALMADRNRAQMLLTLLGGVPQSGSALAEAAGISRSLASAHLKKLVAGGLVQARPNGRQRLYSIASEPVADALEILILLAPASKVSSLRDATRARSLRWARMCYDHLAGAVGVSVTEALLGHDLLREQDGGYVLGPAGRGRVRPLRHRGGPARPADPAAAAALPGLERAPLPPGGQPGRGADQDPARAAVDRHQGGQPHRRRDRGGSGGPAGVAGRGPGRPPVSRLILLRRRPG